MLDRVLEATGAFGLVALTLAGVHAGVSRLQLSKNLITSGTEGGSTTVSPTIAVLVASCVIAIAAVILIPPPIDQRSAIEALASHALLTSFALGAIVLAPFQFHRWRWNSEFIEWEGAWRKVQIPWGDIATAGPKRWSHGEFVVRGKNGDRIEWSILTLGVDALFEALLRYRPDLSDVVSPNEALS